MNIGLIISIMCWNFTFSKYVYIVEKEVCSDMAMEVRKRKVKMYLIYT